MHADEGFAEISMGNVDYKVTADTANNYAGGQTTGIESLRIQNAHRFLPKSILVRKSL